MTLVDTPNAKTIAELVEQFNLPEKWVHLVLINGVYIQPEDRAVRPLVDGEVLAIWPPVALIEQDALAAQALLSPIICPDHTGRKARTRHALLGLNRRKICQPRGQGGYLAIVQVGGGNGSLDGLRC